MVLLIKLYNKYENMVIDRMSPIQCTIEVIKHASYIIYIMTQQLFSLSLSLFTHTHFLSLTTDSRKGFFM